MDYYHNAFQIYVYMVSCDGLLSENITVIFQVYLCPSFLNEIFSIDVMCLCHFRFQYDVPVFHVRLHRGVHGSLAPCGQGPCK